MKRIQKVRSFIIYCDPGMQTTNVAIIQGFKSRPRRSFGVRHGNSAGVVTTMSTQTLGATQDLKGTTFIFFKQSIGMVLGDTAIVASTAGKGGDAGSGIDNDRLSLGRGTAPQIGVMRAVSLKEFGHGGWTIVVLQLATSGVSMRTIRHEFLGYVAEFLLKAAALHDVGDQRNRNNLFGLQLFRRNLSR